MVPLLKVVLVTAAGVFTGGLMVDAYGSISPAPAPAPALATTSATAPSGQPRALRMRIADALLTIVSTDPGFLVEPKNNYSERSSWRWVDDDCGQIPGAVTVVPEAPQTAELAWGFADGADHRNTSNLRITFNLTFTNTEPSSVHSSGPEKCTKEWRVTGKDPKLILENTWGECEWFEYEVSEPKEYVKDVFLGEKNQFGIFLSKKVTAPPSSTHAGRPRRARQVPGGSLSISVKDDDDLRFSVSAVGQSISWPEPFYEHPVVADLSAGHEVKTWIYYNLEDVAIVNMTFTNTEPSSEKCNIIATFKKDRWRGFEETGECDWCLAAYSSSPEFYRRSNGLANHFSVVVEKVHAEVTASASSGTGDVGPAGASPQTPTMSAIVPAVAPSSPQPAPAKPKHLEVSVMSTDLGFHVKPLAGNGAAVWETRPDGTDWETGRVTLAVGGEAHGWLGYDNDEAHFALTFANAESKECKMVWKVKDLSLQVRSGACEWFAYEMSKNEANRFKLVLVKPHENVTSPASTTRTGSFVPAVVAVASPQSEREEDGWTSAARYALPAFLLAAALTVAVAAAVTMRNCTPRARDLQTSRFETELGLVQSAANP